MSVERRSGRAARFSAFLAGVALAAALVAPSTSTATPTPEASSNPAPAVAGCDLPTDPIDPIGGDRYFWCMAAQTMKVIGLFTGNPYLVLGGAVAGGVACGLGA